MPATLTHVDGAVFRLDVSGTLRREDLEPCERMMAAEIDARGTARLLVVAQNFAGWAADGNWSDLDFYIAHGGRIDRIAIVAEPRWREPLMLFANSDLRGGAVEYFVPGALGQAETWLSQ